MDISDTISTSYSTTVCSCMSSQQCHSVTTNTVTGTTLLLRIDDTEDKEAIYEHQDMIRRVALEVGMEFIVLLVAIGVNMGYVGIVYFARPSNLAAVQFAFALIKSLFSSMVPVMTDRLPKSSRQLHALFMNVGVNILSPGIATLFLSPLCLYYKFNRQSISPTYEYPYELYNVASCLILPDGSIKCETSQQSGG